MSQHLNDNLLLQYLLEQSLAQTDLIHLHQCSACQDKLKDIRITTGQLKRIESIDYLSPNEIHMCDTDLLGYINKSLDENNYQRIHFHLQQCGTCKKAYLLQLTHNLQTEESYQNSQAQDTGIRNEGSLSGNSEHNESNKFSKPRYALAASLFLLAGITGSIAYNFMNLQQTPPNQVSPLRETASNASINSVNLSLSPKIDWSANTITVYATGTADMSKMSNRVQAEMVATKTARQLALAQLSETVNGIQINAHSTYQELLLQNDSLVTASQGYIRGAKEIQRTIEWIDNTPRVVVAMQLPLFSGNPMGLGSSNTSAHNLRLRISTTTDTINHSMLTRQQVIIDTRNTRFRPTIQPTIVSIASETHVANLVHKQNGLNSSNYIYEYLQSNHTSAIAEYANLLKFNALPNSSTGTLLLTHQQFLRLQELAHQNQVLFLVVYE
ncbi:MAG: hypothetical protein OEY38_16535 [Gammaproteobacteria bacterium]|nr:hypothetical protein [Gammaproteobacteria bacterium]